MFVLVPSQQSNNISSLERQIGTAIVHSAHPVLFFVLLSISKALALPPPLTRDYHSHTTHRLNHRRPRRSLSTFHPIASLPIFVYSRRRFCLFLFFALSRFICTGFLVHFFPHGTSDIITISSGKRAHKHRH